MNCRARHIHSSINISLHIHTLALLTAGTSNVHPQNDRVQFIGRIRIAVIIKADSYIAYHVHAVPLPCHDMPLIHTRHATPLPRSDSATSSVKVRVVAVNIPTASPTV